jgi:gentisate 1,2-dioxygenase
MTLQLFPKFFATPADVLDDVKKNDTWPTTFVSGPSEGLPVHWHSDEVHAYIMEGETDFLDADSGERIPASAGDKVIVPARQLHAEGVVKDRVVFIFGIPKPMLPDEFLKMHDPSDL